LTDLHWFYTVYGLHWFYTAASHDLFWISEKKFYGTCV